MNEIIITSVIITIVTATILIVGYSRVISEIRKEHARQVNILVLCVHEQILDRHRLRQRIATLDSSEKTPVSPPPLHLVRYKILNRLRQPDPGVSYQPVSSGSIVGDFFDNGGSK